MSYIIYHNSRCSKSRCALQKLEDEGKEFTVVEYLKTPLSEAEIAELVVKLGIKAEDLIRKTEAIYKEEFKGKNLSETEWIAAMAKYPKLIQRPIIVKGEKAVIGRPEENIDTL